MANKLANPADYIVPLNINKLDGRMLYMPAPSDRQRQILLVYGHHGTLERWWGLVENLHEYGAVTMPDLPGFGGMDSFFRIKKRPTIDAFADYLATFINLRFKRKRITIMAISYGFVVTTRMLQRYPEIAKKVDVLISAVGFMHRDDFWWSPLRRQFYSSGTRLLATRPVSLFIRYCCLNQFILKRTFLGLPKSKQRLLDVTPAELEATLSYELVLWRTNDVRTHWLTTSEFLKVDNCKQQVALPVIHVVAKNENYFNNEVVKQHMLVVFKKYRRFVAESKTHTPSILADKKAAGVLLPPGLRRILAKR